MIKSRRKFLKQSALYGTTLPILPSMLLNGHFDTDLQNLNVSIFSKHLQFLDYKQTGQMAAELGFDGVDLTVRPKGHVLPDAASEQLPRAIHDIQAGGSTCKMMTTSNRIRGQSFGCFSYRDCRQTRC